MSALVGFSRIYLGDYYPGDVLSVTLSGMTLAENAPRVQRVVVSAADRPMDTIDWLKR